MGLFFYYQRNLKKLYSSFFALTDILSSQYICMWIKGILHFKLTFSSTIGIVVLSLNVVFISFYFYCLLLLVLYITEQVTFKSKNKIKKSEKNCNLHHILTETSNIIYNIGTKQILRTITRSKAWSGFDEEDLTKLLSRLNGPRQGKVVAAESAQVGSLSISESTVTGIHQVTEFRVSKCSSTKSVSCPKL